MAVVHEYRENNVSLCNGKDYRVDIKVNGQLQH